jgi:hypothetical protein
VKMAAFTISAFTADSIKYVALQIYPTKNKLIFFEA